MRLFVILFVTLALTLGATFTGGTPVQDETLVVATAMSPANPSPALDATGWRTSGPCHWG